ncbi:MULTISPECIES: dihydroxyacetone kinase subunit DhaL [unclassified Aureimonas]|uniref:dihydroxyacetone kinase subunit DhaL n=1 Tax=unclassified Aureimonas TaxID=2615206 RepID=UPI0006FEC00B|nr:MULTISPECIES: dihydroxyacetone kinase subunit DhaL [unclassified Aureimonas]KQT70076.1 dihydroxyacetone kinase [Aureimonas sp. Leaf427]KQT75974.1 dihydroxyacetone kinase [Aureimonas sp. Leaf460]
MQHLPNAGSGGIVTAMAERIVANKAYLSEIDGKIGDGDHGVNMAKGFGMAAERLAGKDASLGQAFAALSEVLMGEIGGSMGPLYGMMFTEFSDAIEGKDAIDPQTFGAMLRAGLEGVQSIGSAKLGDKTMLDAFIPASEAFDATIESGASFADALAAMESAAETGRDSTIDLVAKIGRAARLGERSRGVLDAGATSCALILKTLGEGAASRLTDG